MDEELPIGRRVHYWRTRRKLTLQVFADRVGKSKSWLEKVERGERRLDSLSAITEVANALEVDVSVLRDHASVRELLKVAGSAANELGADSNHYWTSFGQTNVELHRAAAAVELGEGRQAVDIHENLDRRRFAALVPERRAGTGRLTRSTATGGRLTDRSRAVPPVRMAQPYVLGVARPGRPVGVDAAGGLPRTWWKPSGSHRR